MTLHYAPEISGGVLLSRLGYVHRRWTTRSTLCGQSVPDWHTTVSHTQAVVHKLPLCNTCYPAHHKLGGHRGSR